MATKRKSIILFSFLFIFLFLNSQIFPVFATTIFSDGFESGNFSAWTGISDANGRLSVQGTTKHHGDYAAKITNAPSGESPYFYKTITATATTYTRVYVRFESLPDANGDWITFIVVGNAANWYPMYAAVRHDGTSAKWFMKNGYFGGSDYADGGPAIDTWYCVELRVTNGAGGPVTLYVDDVEVASVAQSAVYNQDSIRVGAANTGDGYGVYGFTATAEYDCVVVADAYIGPEEEEEGEYSYTFIETLNPSAMLNQWQEQAYTFTQTLVTISTLTYSAEAVYTFTQTITPYETISFWQEHIYIFTQPLSLTATLNYGIEGIQVFFEIFTETLHQTAILNYAMELAETFITNIETLTPQAFLYYSIQELIEEITIEFALAALGIILALVALALVVTKKG